MPEYKFNENFPAESAERIICHRQKWDAIRSMVFSICMTAVLISIIFVFWG